MTDIATVRMLSGNNQISDDFISFFLQESEDFIKSYCNIDSVPKGLHNTLLKMAAYKVNANTTGGVASAGKAPREVSSISDGNQSISYSSGSNSKTFQGDDDLVITFGNVLGRYRCMVTANSGNRHMRRY